MSTSDDTEDLSWLDDRARASAEEILQVLFSTSHICLVMFDARGAIIGLNPQAASFQGVAQAHTRFEGFNLLEHATFCRLGMSDHLRRVLAGETIEVTDTRWITLFSGEERFLDIAAGPVTVDGRVIGGVAYLVDSTKRHRAEVAETANRKRARELEVFLARDVAKLVAALETWSRSQPPSLEETAVAMGTIDELSTLLGDLLRFLQIGTFQPHLERLLLAEVLEQARIGERATVETPAHGGPIAVIADQRLLRRVLRNLHLFTIRAQSGRWRVSAPQGRVIVTLEVAESPARLAELLTANSLSTAEATSADGSLAAARWMAEIMGATLRVQQSPAALVLDLPAADPALAGDTDASPPS